MASNVSAADVNQQNFNPSWMKSAFHGSPAPGSRVSAMSEESGDVQDLVLPKPKLSKYRYGREELLALKGDAASIPAGLPTCPFFVLRGQEPIVCSPLSDFEEKFQQNVNSSKAMSSLTHAERANVNAGGLYVGNSNPNGQSRGGNSGGWTPVKSGRAQNSATTPRGGTRTPGRGGIRINTSGVTTDAVSEDISPSTGQRFAFRGRGGTATVVTGRGGSISGSLINSRAQGLYDPRNPSDRPRNRLRSTSDDGDKDTLDTSKSASSRPVWASKDSSWKEASWSSLSREGNLPQSSNAQWKNDSHGHLLDWSDDDNDVEKRVVSRQTVPTGGAFDDDVHFKHQNSQESGHSSMNPSNGSESLRDPISTTTNKAPWAIANAIEMLNSNADPLSYAKTIGLPVPSFSGQPNTGTQTPSLPIQFYYVDPNNATQGPFTQEQMETWLNMGYFKDDLKVKRSCDSVYMSIHELKIVNGAQTPFSYRDESVPVSVPRTEPYNSLTGFLSGSNSIWQESGLTPVSPVFSQAVQQQQQMDEARRIEYQLKLRESELLQMVQRQAEEKERMLLKRELEMKQKEEEIKRQAEEQRLRMEEEQLEMSRRMKQMEEENRNRLEEEMKKLEIERKREEERIAEELRKKAEAEAKRIELLKKEEEEIKKRIAAERAAEELRLELQRKSDEDSARIKKQLEAARLAEEKKEQQLKEEREREKERQVQEQKQQKQLNIEESWEHQASNAADSEWQSVSKKPSKPKGGNASVWSAPSAQSSEKTLRQIQEEEERQIAAEKKELARIKKEEAVSAPQSTTWASASQRISWTQPVKAIPPSVGPSRPAWGGAALEHQKPVALSNWDGPSLQAANKPKSVSSSAANKSAAVTVTSAKKDISKKPEADAFNKWAVQKLIQISSSTSTEIDAEVLATFLATLENPNEVDDYVEGYFGSTKLTKEFVKEFLSKRSELRRRNTDKDDLSSASRAPTTGTSAMGNQGKKKKGKGQRLIVDGSCLGFRATSDPNRVNQGEIETVGLAPGQKR